MQQAMDTPIKLQLQGAAKVLSYQKQKLKEGRLLDEVTMIAEPITKTADLR